MFLKASERIVVKFIWSQAQWIIMNVLLIINSDVIKLKLRKRSQPCNIEWIAQITNVSLN